VVYGACARTPARACFFTDADLLANRLTGEGAALVRRAIETCQIGPLIEEAAFSPRQSGLTAAHHSFLDACSGPGWIAAGDASISFDPISSQGLLHALFSGLSAAEAADRYLTGEPEAVYLYQRVIDDIRHVYSSRVADYYATETRWTAAPFWQRRFRLESLLELFRVSGMSAAAAPIDRAKRIWTENLAGEAGGPPSHHPAVVE
jgi:hypothetical protein